MTAQPLPTVLAKLAAHLKTLRSFVERSTARYFDPRVVLPRLAAIEGLVTDLRMQRPDLFSDVLSRPLPERSVCDNGPEFAGQVLDRRTHERGVTLHFIEPGKTVQKRTRKASTADSATSV